MQISSGSTHNAATLNDEVTLAPHAITEKRVATIGYPLDESRQRHTVDDPARGAIHHYDCDTGHKLRAQMRDYQGLQESAGLFTYGLESQVYEMEPVSANQTKSIVLFHYCSYVSCWRQQGRGAGEIETLRDIYMEDDHALTDAPPGLRLKMQVALARDDAACWLYSYQSESHEMEW